MTTAIWPGSAREFARLLKAVARNCTCEPMPGGLVAQQCAAHAMLRDQTDLDHLLYVFRTRGVFVRREFYAEPVTAR
jgi:hypothetical protein